MNIININDKAKRKEKRIVYSWKKRSYLHKIMIMMMLMKYGVYDDVVAMALTPILTTTTTKTQNTIHL